MGSIRLADARTWSYHQQESQTDVNQGECDVFLEDDSGDEGEDEQAQLESRRQVLGNTGAQLSRVDISNGVVDTPTDVQDEDYEFIPSTQETNSRSNGVNESNRAVSSTLSSKAGIILVSLPSFFLPSVSLIDNPFFIFVPFISTGYPQHLHCRSSIPRHWIRGYPIWRS